jgi:hypothetical protein
VGRPRAPGGVRSYRSNARAARACAAWPRWISALGGARRAVSASCYLNVARRMAMCKPGAGRAERLGGSCGPRVCAVLRVGRGSRVGAGQCLWASSCWPAQPCWPALPLTPTLAGSEPGPELSRAHAACRAALSDTRAPRARPLFMKRPSARCCVPPTGSECAAAAHPA